MKPFRIFRPGKHTASCGTQVEFTEADLKRAVEVYSAQLYAAPLVIGHPKTEDRAHGYAEKLSYEDGHVVAHPDKVNPKFAEAVKSGAFRNRSASWYMPDHPNNPSPGNLYPKHIGFLGAAAPAIKGLGDVEFSEAVSFAEETHPELVVEFADANADKWSLASMLSSTARILRGLRDAMLADKGAEETDKLMPAWQIEDLERQAIRLEEQARTADAGLLPGFTESNSPEGTPTMTPAEIAALQAQNAEQATRLAQFTERETALQAAERLATVSAIDAQLDPLVKAGKILPAQRKPLANFAADLDDQGQVIEFGEADAAGVVPKVSPRAFLLGFLGSLPKSVDYSERGASTTANSGALTPRQLAVKAGDYRDKVKRESGREISFTEATNAVLAEAGVAVEEPSTTPAV